MRRRVEHGLLFGDIRMIHDPLASRHRAMLFSGVAVALIAAVAGLFAWLRPNPDPGDASILRDMQGNLLVRVGDRVHPVTNLTSARLIAGAPDEPARVGDAVLATLPRGVPIGIPSAPSLFAPADSPASSWSACELAGTVTVIAGYPSQSLDDATAVLATAGGKEWLITRAGRAELPDAQTPQGRVLRRGLGIDSATPRWSPPAQLLWALEEQPPLAFPADLPEVVDSDGQAWALNATGGIQPVTPLQAELLVNAGALERRVERAELSTYADADPPLDVRLPALRPVFLDPGSQALCATQDGGASTMSVSGGTAGAIELSGRATATRFIGLQLGAVGVDTGHGYHVVSAQGLRHEVPDRDTLTVVGAVHVEEVPWEIIALLPEGEALSAKAAGTALY
ncbi:ESX-1 secretion system protein eccB1 [Corynebacterium capitovis DSM 44611]|nr:ESX-1 secretion system protein eccB1 [Corynebacterium capitovis DSM 44611]